MIKPPKEIQLTKEWIEKFVVDLSLCPFARYSFEADKILYKISVSNKPKQCLEDLVRLVVLLANEEDSKHSNGFLIMNPKLTFFFLLDLKEMLDDFLSESEYEGMYQTVVFHPHFQFADEKFDAHGNFTNRSPYPMIHILNVDEVTSAIEGYEDVDIIPIRNNEILNKLAIDSVEDVFANDFASRVEKLRLNDE